MLLIVSYTRAALSQCALLNENDFSWNSRGHCSNAFFLTIMSIKALASYIIDAVQAKARDRKCHAFLLLAAGATSVDAMPPPFTWVLLLQFASSGVFPDFTSIHHHHVTLRFCLPTADGRLSSCYPARHSQWLEWLDLSYSSLLLAHVKSPVVYFYR